MNKIYQNLIFIIYFMADKYIDNENYNLPLLKKKSSRRKKLQKLDKEFDLEKYKDRVFKELGQKELV